uniref:Probable vacuolar protein sorting-associated protein 16 homolog n=1 Tax=Bartheletia paradoxa TaxID=669517 RepID=A0A2D0XHS4_9BASI|nr:hypothetical protein SPAR04372 [Bartheletia paradoxa]
MSTTPIPSVTWSVIPSTNVYYRKRQIYTLLWSLPSLSDFVIAGARFGGPIALLRDDSKLLIIGPGQGHTAGRPKIHIYSLAGELIVTIPWDLPRPLAIGFTPSSTSPTTSECLCVINRDGTYRLYHLSGSFTSHSLGPLAAERGLSEACIHDGGIVALLAGGGGEFVEVKGWEGAVANKMAKSGINGDPHCWSVIPPDQSEAGVAQVLVSTGETILTVDSIECIEQNISLGPFTHLAPSPSGKFVALHSASGFLHVVSVDFQRSLSQFNTVDNGPGGLPEQVEWCGDHAVVLKWGGKVMLVGPFGGSISYDYASDVYLIGEIDGVRIISGSSSDFLQRVPESTSSVFSPGSTTPSALLFDAVSALHSGSPKAFEQVRSILPELSGAVDDCIESAARENDPHWTKMLLKAAAFGKGAIEGHDPREFVRVGKTIRALNAVRAYEIGLPITYDQLQHLSPPVLLSRLTARGHHLLALRLASLLDLSAEGVLEHWAQAKIASQNGRQAPDDELCRVIVDRFASVQGRMGSSGAGVGVRYGEVARKAWEAGRAGLATLLLDYEVRPADQVPLLLSMKEDRRALVKAIGSGDADLVYHVLLTLQSHLALSDLFRLVDSPDLLPASRLLQVYAREQDRELLRDFFYQNDKRTESGLLCLEEATREADVEKRSTKIKTAQKFFSEDKDRSFEAKMTEDHVRLIAFQQTLDKEAPADSGGSFVGLSVNGTIDACLRRKMTKRAEKVRADWKVPDKRFWHVKLHALVSIRDFTALSAFAALKKSPIGYEPFVEALLTASCPTQATTFVERCEPRNRVELYVRCNEWARAGAECKDRKDRLALQRLIQNAPNTLVQRELDAILSSMDNRR